MLSFMATSTASEPDRPIDEASWIVLTMGDRRDDLARAVGSIPTTGASQTEVIVVVNGAADVQVPSGARVIELPENVGIPAGRNAGAEAATGGLLLFLDDDATVVDDGLVKRTIAHFRSEPELAVISFRIADPTTGETARRHVPRPGRRDPSQSGPATSFLGGACAIRRSAFQQVGGLPADYFYALEETDLSWRLLDAGWRVHYDGQVAVHHPRTEISRHGFSTRLTARNRVLLVRRLLPWPLGLVYLANWFAITMLRGRRLQTAKDHMAGTREGFARPVERCPIRWKTVWRLTRLGRPPII